MVEKKIRVLILEDKPEDAKELKLLIQDPIEVTIVNTSDQAAKLLAGGFDCFAFDEMVPGDLVGHEILINGIREGIIQVPCIIMTARLDLTFLQNKYGETFAAYIDKRDPIWIASLQSSIIGNAGKDYRPLYLEKQFGRINCLDRKLDPLNFEDVSFSDWKFLGKPSVKDLIAAFKDPNADDSDKKHLFDFLAQEY